MKLHCREAPVWTFSYNMDKSESFCDVTSGLLAGHWKVLFRPKSPKWPTLTPRSSATVRRTKQFSGPQLTGSWTTTCSKHLSAVHPLTCSLLCVWCLFYPLRVWGFCANDHWLESFRKFLSKICVLTAIHVSKIGGCEVAEKSSRIADKKTPASLISAPLNRSRPKIRERCRPLTCACVLTLVQIGCDLPDLFRKESKKWIQL